MDTLQIIGWLILGFGFVFPAVLVFWVIEDKFHAFLINLAAYGFTGLMYLAVKLIEG